LIQNIDYQYFKICSIEWRKKGRKMNTLRENGMKYASKKMENVFIKFVGK